MGAISGFIRLVLGIVFFIAVIIAGNLYAAQFMHYLKGFPGTFQIGSVEIPLLASLIVSVGLTLIINLVGLLFRERS